ncbi:hypothetical protein F4780DRAFT_791066, partial [Xylariomycetidae sp. FL0641]
PRYYRSSSSPDPGAGVSSPPEIHPSPTLPPPAMAVHLHGSSPPFQAVFALDVATAGLAALLAALAAAPTLTQVARRRRRRLTTGGGGGGGRPPLKTPLGTYLFLFPAVACFFLAYALRFASDLLQTRSGPRDLRGGGDLGLRGRPASAHAGPGVAALSYAAAFAAIFFTFTLNGGVWLHASHVLSNGKRDAGAPGTFSKVWNSLVLAAIAGTGLAAWGRALAADRGGSNNEYGRVVEHERGVRILYAVYRAVVVGATLSVAAQTLARFLDVRRSCAKDISERGHLARFALVTVPLLVLRSLFMVYEIVLLYVDTTAWSPAARLATVFLLIVFGQILDLVLLAAVLWGAWRMGKTIRKFEREHRKDGHF